MIGEIGVFVLGLCIGSFLNVLIYRLPRSLTLGGRSFCPKCKKQIAWYDNIPLVSFILLRGKCRKCQFPISLKYPVVELLTGVLFIGVIGGIRVIGAIGVLGYFAIVSAMIAILFIDLEHQIIPDELIAIGVFGALGVFLPSHLSLLTSNLLSAAGASLFFLFLHLITKGKGMGLGDVKLVFLMGLVLGFPKIIGSLYLAFLTGAIVGVILILTKKKRFGEHLPFGPFLVGSFLTFLFWGDRIIQWLTYHFF